MIDYSGQQIGNYRLLRRLGFGGFASVYLGQHVRIATKQAAIKLLHLFDVDSKKFQQEAETTAVLDHPHIIRLIDFDFHDQMPFLVIDYAPGGSLRSRHPEGTQIPLPIVVQYVQEIAKALAYAHGKNVIHRDIKPDNILIGGQEELRLSDFGIAVLSQTGRTSLAASHGVGGTAYYMAPEQSRGKPEKASDQYALGIMVYEWLCGKPPFSEGMAINIQYQHAFEPVPSLIERLPTLPPAVEQVILRALAKDPKERFPHVQDFATTLQEVANVGKYSATLVPSSLPLATVSTDVSPQLEQVPNKPVIRQPEQLAIPQREHASSTYSSRETPANKHLDVASKKFMSSISATASVFPSSPYQPISSHHTPQPAFLSSMPPAVRRGSTIRKAILFIGLLLILIGGSTFFFSFVINSLMKKNPFAITPNTVPQYITDTTAAHAYATGIARSGVMSGFDPAH